jgi:hypothetical protein
LVFAAVIRVGWPDLVDELDRWHEAGREATLWWRDDDAVAPTPQLRRLEAIARRIPIALAVIPGAAQEALANWVADSTRSVPRPHLVVLQHGWLHLNNAGAEKKSEFPSARPQDEVDRDISAGRARLNELFGTLALPVLVPPWNRFDDSHLRLIAGCGVSAISRIKPRRTTRPAPGVVEVNVHVDLVGWKSGLGFIGEEAALGGLVGHLQARRSGEVCADEPTGILSHHLVQDDPTSAFLDRLVEETTRHMAARWLDAAEVFDSTNA